MTELQGKAKAAIDDVIKKLKTGNLSPVVQYVGIKRAAGDTGDLPSDNWSAGNQVLAYATTGCGFDQRGFNQWKSAGRRVKKGAKAGYILVPITRKFQKENPDTGQMEDKQFLAGFKAVAVFARRDTVTASGADDYQEPTYEPENPPEFIEVAKAWNLRVQYTPDLGSAWGSYHITDGEIQLATHEDTVFFHELAHAGHHRVDGKINGGQDPKQETVAEFSACVLKAHCGLGDVTGRAWQYISGYNKDPLRAILACLTKSAEVINLILDTADKIEAEKVAA